MPIYCYSPKCLRIYSWLGQAPDGIMRYFYTIKRKGIKGDNSDTEPVEVLILSPLIK